MISRSNKVLSQAYEPRRFLQSSKIKSAITLKDDNGLTVVVTCKNRTENLLFFISSLEHSNPQPLVILVDFGSDQSLEYLGKMYPAFLEVIRVDNKTDPFHKTRALNIGIKRVTTKYTMLSDVDQVFPSNFFEIVHTRLRMGAAFVTGYAYLLDVLPYFINSSNVYNNYNYLLRFAKLRKARTDGCGCCIATDTAWLNKVHGLDERYVAWGKEDLDLVLRAELDGKKKTYFNYFGVTTIHLPHKKIGSYYSVPCSINEKLYEQRLVKGDIVVNTNTSWGEI